MNATRSAALLLPLLAAAATAGDWPQYHGPAGDRTSPERVALRSWPDDGPPVVWAAPTEGGFSSFAVAGGRAFTLVREEVDGEARELCLALDSATGEVSWMAPLGPARYDDGGDSGAEGNQGGDGPRSTPSVDRGRVYVLDSALGLHCLHAETGAPVWQHDLVAEHEGRPIQWQSAASPLVEGDLVLVAGGGPGQSLLAFHKRSGELVWKTGDERITHATPIAVTLHGVRQVIFYLQSGLVSVAPESGEELWRIEYPYRVSSAASPVVDGDLVYVSAGYGVGAGAWRVVHGEDGFTTEFLWRRRNELMNHWSTPVAKDGRLYGIWGFKEYGEAPLMCVDLATGEELWSQAGFGPGNCILAGDDLVVLSDAGEVALVEARPDAYSEVARATVVSGKCWSTPVLSDGQLYVRSTVEGLRLDLSGAR